MIAALLLLACPKKEAEVVVPEAPPTPVDLVGERPAIPPAPGFHAPVPELLALQSGAKVWLVSRPDLPLVSVRLVIEGGSATDPEKSPGLAALTDTMLTHGAGARTADQFAEEAELQALTIGAETGGTRSHVLLEAHASRLDTGLGLLADAVMRPTFDAKELEKVKGQRAAEIAQNLDDPAMVASMVATRLFFGERHPLGHDSLGSAKAVGGMKSADLKKSWAARFTPDKATFVVAGAIDRTQVVELLEKHFAGWKAGKVPTAALPAPTAAPGRFLVDNPGASQSVLRVILPGWTSLDPELLPARLGSIVLGGTFTSRLNRLLREEKGYTYGAKALVDPMASWGRVVAYTSVRADATGDALKDLLAQIELIRSGVTPEELEKARGARITRLVEAMESRSDIAATFADSLGRGLGPEAVDAEIQAIRATELATVNTAMAKIDLSKAIIVVVGDLGAVRADLEEKNPGTWVVVEKQ